MKKIFYTILFLSAFGIFNIAHASTVNDYTRTPSNFSFSETEVNFDLNVTPSINIGGYRIKIVGNLSTTYGTCNTRTASTADIELNENVTLVIDNYNSVSIELHEDEDCASLYETLNLETGTPSFEITEPPTELEILQEMKDNLESFLLIFLFFFIFFNFIKLFK
jgi:hypothetical protein